MRLTAFVSASILTAGVIFSTTAEDCSGSTTDPGGSLYFSEYVEGQSWDKALEIYNASSDAVDLSEVVIWKGSNGAPFPGDVLYLEGVLEAGGTFVLSHSAANDVIKSKSQLLTSWADFNGNDALALVHNGEMTDVIGLEGEDPGTGWAVAGIAEATVDHTLIRAEDIELGDLDWVSQAGSSADDAQWSVELLGGWQTLGAHPHVGEGDACYSGEQCSTGLSCQGSPAYVEEEMPGCCVPNRPIPGEGEFCNSDAQCAEGLLCIAEICSPEWMAGTYTNTEAASIPDGGVLSQAIIVDCLASVPETGTVSVYIEHENPSSLKVFLLDPAQDVVTPIFDQGQVEGTTLIIEDVAVRHSGDDAVNGPWTLIVEDLEPGGEGQLLSWSLSVRSRFD